MFKVVTDTETKIGSRREVKYLETEDQVEIYRQVQRLTAPLGATKTIRVTQDA